MTMSPKTKKVLTIGALVLGAMVLLRVSSAILFTQKVEETDVSP